MAGEVADGEKDRLVLLAGFFEGFVAPRIPVNRIVRMQEKVRAFRVNESVRIAILGTRGGLRLRGTGRSCVSLPARTGCKRRRHEQDGRGTQRYSPESLSHSGSFAAAIHSALSFVSKHQARPATAACIHALRSIRPSERC